MHQGLPTFRLHKTQQQPGNASKAPGEHTHTTETATQQAKMAHSKLCDFKEHQC